ncbi:hypothetical protein [Pseudoalteromonas maricaloris]|uniref:hypothetical protein n=1 Tax=Pseudoalteromonas maricaloris TaxID=184924 RepID=UPI000299E576|nr:hypothetical protein [Pseudoalteromonas flavipulchra]
MGASKKHLIRKAEVTPFNVVTGRTQTLYQVHIKPVGNKRWTALAEPTGNYQFSCPKARDAFFDSVLAAYPATYRKSA